MKRLFYIFSSVFCFITISNKAYSQQWISIDGTPQGKAVTKTVLESNQYTHKVRVSIHGLHDNLISRGNHNYHFLSIDEIGRLSIVGEPSLPIINQLIAIPPGSKMTASVEELEWTDVKMETVYPAQDPIKKSGHDSITINEQVYGKSFLPAIVSTGKEMTWKGIKNKGVAVCPFRYYPQENRLSVLKEFVIRIVFSQIGSPRKDIVQEQTNPLGLFDNIVYKEKSQESSIHSGSDNYKYLIIVGSNITINNQFINKLKDFRMWKAMKGYKSKVKYRSEIDNQGISIKDYITQEKLNGVEYVLLIGDVGNVPSGYIQSQDGTEYFRSDYWYGCSGNSYWAEVYLGRFSIGSVDDFVHMVDKTIRYESSYVASNNTLLVAHHQGAPDSDSYQGCSQYIKDTYQNYMSFTTAYGASQNYGYQGDNATNQDVIDQINLGTHIINYRGHGGDSFWGNPSWNYSGESFYDSLIEDMDSATCAVFFSIACSTGNIAGMQNCMLETFTRSDHGAVAFIGATNSSDRYGNNDYNKIIYDKLLNNHIYQIGQLNVAAHVGVLTLYSNGNEYPLSALQSGIDNAYSYICGGDPTLELWTAVPQTIGDVSFSCNNGDVTVNTGLSGSYYLSVVTAEGEQVDTINVTGSTCTFALPTGNFYIAINKHNFYPYVIYYDTESDYIQNMTFYYDAYYNNSPLDIGYQISSETSYGNVVVKAGKKLIVKKGSDNVHIEQGFKCEKGAVFEIK